MKPSLLLVGLGNPGTQYANTRHNTGFRALDVLSEAFAEGEWQEKQKFNSLIQEGRIVTAPVLLVKPQTYMNRSGEAIQKLLDFYKLNPAESLLVLCDDIDLPLGTVRLRRKGGPGTHNGLKSVVEHIGEEFPRLRIGLGQPAAGTDLATWVLNTFSKDEMDAMQKTIAEVPTMVREFALTNVTNE